MKKNQLSTYMQWYEFNIHNAEQKADQKYINEILYYTDPTQPVLKNA